MENVFDENLVGNESVWRQRTLEQSIKDFQTPTCVHRQALQTKEAGIYFQERAELRDGFGTLQNLQD